ncbi:MAG: HAD family phosphatase [Actinomycetota bacterium]|nr:HAD family phosphatase [Actinomycetota bacterium]
MSYRAVVFDLWQTLVPWPIESAQRLYGDLAERFGAEPERFRELWLRGRAERELGPIEPHLRSLADELGFVGDLAPVVTLRREWTRAALVPRPDAVPTLEELRRRGFRLGMISACSQDVPDVWAETPFRQLFDVAVFSCSVDVSKPDPRIYEHCCAELGVAARECVFVGDGANDELPGAERVGMTAVQLRAPGEPLTPEGERWTGAYVARLSNVLELVGEPA